MDKTETKPDEDCSQLFSNNDSEMYNKEIRAFKLTRYSFY